jgi:hypothetical protein
MKKKILTHVTVLAAILLGVAAEEEGKQQPHRSLILEPIYDTLNGVGYQNSAVTSGLYYLSMAGGAPITVSGQFMANKPELNTIMFEPLWVDNYELYGPALTCMLNIISFLIIFYL